ncbi:MAG: hypothetical protein M1828_003047 [Chrysothrix sp. TS-e1954]|nr:MAG: hypothetical protein M1828_003047 [Chrysothrix sp. TS-e1954]
MAKKRASPVDDSDEELAPAKRVKPSDDSSEPAWDLNGSGTRRITVSEFKGKTMINIREFYGKDGAKLPGKKGISLPIDQWQMLINAMPEIETALKTRGESVVRPLYKGEGDIAQPEQKEGNRDSDKEGSAEAGEGDVIPEGVSSR